MRCSLFFKLCFFFAILYFAYFIYLSSVFEEKCLLVVNSKHLFLAIEYFVLVFCFWLSWALGLKREFYTLHLLLRSFNFILCVLLGLGAGRANDCISLKQTLADFYCWHFFELPNISVKIVFNEDIFILISEIMNIKLYDQNSVFFFLESNNEIFCKCLRFVFFSKVMYIYIIYILYIDLTK